MRAQEWLHVSTNNEDQNFCNKCHCIDVGSTAAKALVQEVLDKYQGLLQKLSADEKGKLERSMGLKMEQLKVGAFHFSTFLNFVIQLSSQTGSVSIIHATAISTSL